MDLNRDDKCGNHQHTRARGQLWIGPLQAKGYDNRVIELVYVDADFNNSMEGARFLDAMRPKYNNKRGLCNQRRMKLYSIASD